MKTGTGFEAYKPSRNLLLLSLYCISVTLDLILVCLDWEFLIQEDSIMRLVFINIFRDTIKCQFAVATLKYSRNNFLCIDLILVCYISVYFTSSVVVMYFTCWHVTSFSCTNDLINWIIIIIIIIIMLLFVDASACSNIRFTLEKLCVHDISRYYMFMYCKEHCWLSFIVSTSTLPGC